MRLLLSALDTWFFRDTTPFHMGASPQSGVASIFPPYPPTITGAARAALALQRGWNGRDRWSRELVAVLGNGPDDLGQLRITGPFVARDGALLFAMPQHVVGKPDATGRWQPLALLTPGDEVWSDLGRVRLPVPDRSDERRLRPTTTCRVTTAGLTQIARGELPHAAQLVDEDALWTREARVGIARHPASRTTKDGEMYSTEHIRPAHHVGLALDIEGVPATWPAPRGAWVPLGGESRLAYCEIDDARPLALPALASPDACVALIALAPLLVSADQVRGEAGLAALDAQIIGACAERPLRIGGWDSDRRAALPLRNALPAGSTLFCTLRHPERFHAQHRDGLVRIGCATAGGFGLCAIGRVPPSPQETR